MKKLLSVSGALALVSLLAVAGCDDPAKGKAKATTGEAVTASTTTANAAPASVTETAALKTYAFDPTSSKVSWTGSKVTGKHEGGFKAFTGTIKAPDGALEKGSVNVDIDTKSLFADNEKLTGHLMSKEFFEVEAFPKATFASTKVDKGGANGATHTITGNLTLHGVTKSVSFPATVKVEGDAVSVASEFAINRKDFGLNYPGKADDLIRDEVVIKLDIKGKKS
jgi:polyisoprenoid-binding protein YceI